MANFVLTAGAAFAVLGTAAAAQDLTEVSFGTNWVAQAEHGGYYQAVADGTYEACGLDVTIVPGGPQANNRALMMAGRIQFNMGGNMLQAFSAVKEGIPLVVVAATFQKEPQMLMTHPGRVSSFEELTGLDTMIIGDNGFQSYYQWLITEYGFDAGKRVPYTFNPARFISDEDSAQQGYVTSEPFAVEKEGGFAPDIWLLADHGFSTYATLIETMQATIDESPEVVKCFVEGSAIGWANFLYGDNAAGIAAIKADNAEMTDDQIAFSIEKLKEFGLVDSGDAQELGIGAMTDERNQDFYQKMVASGVIEDGIDIASSYTTEFSNSGAALPVVKALTGK
ncbi:ABC transporter substrate-binding protein [Mangrovicoccus algicola]|uniref:ABC transporter substrate-binding protein n=1 Tax=Mangrovicoccus algicola TaxID=2771008 RepID=A0A8J6YU46_9RHOB|nr:ABC transporter substrate-binding protein [Mangrovicoccus algicola]MBE3637735.1 ABC transporter substrate-binding protein [Mangrovicoccus algicola]